MTISVEKLEESKNFINYREMSTGIRLCLEREQLQTALCRFKLYRRIANLTDFYTNLYRLMDMADEKNLLNFLVGFTAETVIYILWSQSKLKETKFIEKLEKELSGQIFIPLP